MWRRLKYPKFLLLIITIILAYIIFSQRSFEPFHNALISLGYIGTFITGMFFTYGFTSAPAVAILLILAPYQNIFLASLIAGLGAMMGDLLIFKFVRSSFSDEIKKLSKEKSIKKLGRNHFIKHLIPVFAGIIIASPLPDEIGVSLFASSTKISTKLFAVISYILNTLGIFIILYIGKLI